VRLLHDLPEAQALPLAGRPRSANSYSYSTGPPNLRPPVPRAGRPPICAAPLDVRRVPRRSAGTSRRSAPPARPVASARTSTTGCEPCAGRSPASSAARRRRPPGRRPGRSWAIPRSPRCGRGLGTGLPQQAHQPDTCRRRVVART